MKFKRQIIKMYNKLIDYRFLDDPEYLYDPKELLLIIETKTFVYSVAQYLCENSEYLTFSYSVDGKTWECVSVRTDEVVAISITDGDDIFSPAEGFEKDHNANMYQ